MPIEVEISWAGCGFLSNLYSSVILSGTEWSEGSRLLFIKLLTIQKRVLSLQCFFLEENHCWSRSSG
jgi:hypothetical protein